MGIIFLEAFIHIRMTLFTGLLSYVLTPFLLRPLLAEGWEYNEGNQNDYSDNHHPKILTPLHK
jgi:hypothetical protein